jgi:hypothetical protein
MGLHELIVCLSMELIVYISMVIPKLLLVSIFIFRRTFYLFVVNLNASKSAKQNNLSPVDSNNLMMDNIDEVTDK